MAESIIKFDYENYVNKVGNLTVCRRFYFSNSRRLDYWALRRNFPSLVMHQQKYNSLTYKKKLTDIRSNIDLRVTLSPFLQIEYLLFVSCRVILTHKLKSWSEYICSFYAATA